MNSHRSKKVVIAAFGLSLGLIAGSVTAANAGIAVSQVDFTSANGNTFDQWATIQTTDPVTPLPFALSRTSLTPTHHAASAGDMGLVVRIYDGNSDILCESPWTYSSKLYLAYTTFHINGCTRLGKGNYRAKGRTRVLKSNGTYRSEVTLWTGFQTAA